MNKEVYGRARYWVVNNSVVWCVLSVGPHSLFRVVIVVVVILLEFSLFSEFWLLAKITDKVTRPNTTLFSELVYIRFC